MKKKTISPVGLTAGGVGPRIIISALPFLITAIICEIFFPAICRFNPGYPAMLKIPGFVHTGLGLVLYIGAVFQFSRNFPKGKLITSGIYGISRNPIYATWIVFVLPGLSLAFNNWIFLLTDLVFSLAFSLLIRKEESDLESVFGREYIIYKQQVGRIGFIPS